MQKRPSQDPCAVHQRLLLHLPLPPVRRPHAYLLSLMVGRGGPKLKHCGRLRWLHASSLTSPPSRPSGQGSAFRGCSCGLRDPPEPHHAACSKHQVMKLCAYPSPGPWPMQ
jgi:hypothetical protein